MSTPPEHRPGRTPPLAQPPRAWIVAQRVLLAVALLAVLGAFWRSWTTAPVDLQRLQRITRLLAMDPVLMWRQRAGLDTTFEGTRVWTDGEGMRLATPPDDPARNRPRGHPEIVVFGASPTFGYGVEGPDAWPAVLEDRLRSDLPDVRVRNAGQIGFSSWQGRRLVDQVIDEWTPDLVVIDYVVNDVERIRFFFPDGREDGVADPPSSLRARVANAVRFLPPTGLLLDALARLAVYAAPSMDPRRVHELAHVRSSPAAYADNLRAMVARCRECGARVVFVERAFRLPQPVPPAPEGLDARVARAEAALAAGDGDAARAAADAVVAADPDGSLGHALRGRALDLAGDGDGARESWRAATAALIRDCVRDARRYGAILEDVARELDVPTADPTARMGGDIANMDLFVPGDYIHPNAAGHRVMAECAAVVVLRTLRGGDGPLVEKCEDLPVRP